MSASHHHSHASSHAAESEPKLLLAFALTALTLLIEAIGGWWSGSLALLADAGHMLVDVLALGLAWAGAHYARRPADRRRSFGYARLEVLAGYSNALIQLLLVVWIVGEALLRFAAPQPVLSTVMLLVALFGFSINAVVLRVLHVHDHDDLNIVGAHLHVWGDLLGSLGAVVAALLLRYMGWSWTDPLVALAVALLILRSAWLLLRRSGHILLEGVPDGVEEEEVVAAVIAAAPQIHDVHHLHLWQLAGGKHIATLHVRLTDLSDSVMVLTAIKQVLRERFGIAHATIQVEVSECVDTHCAPNSND